MFRPALLTLLTALLLSTGCTSWKHTVPERTAIEQMLISTSADRAIDTSGLDIAAKKIFLDTQFTIGYDKEYAISAIRESLNRQTVVVDAIEEAEVLVEARVGAMSVDRSEFLIGFPSMPLPIGTEGDGPVLKTPEIPFFRITRHYGRSKIALFARDKATGNFLGSTGIHFGRARHTDWVILFVPFTTTDLYDEFSAE